jgi:hypothetical protein
MITLRREWTFLSGRREEQAVQQVEEESQDEKIDDSIESLVFGGLKKREEV